MIDTITPAGCGSRQRHVIALTAFTIAAISAAAILGALLGGVGSLLPWQPLVVLAMALAGLGVAREIVPSRIPVPQIARQVPERWRRELPLPVWSAGYGAGLGAGLFTHQMAYTFWIVVVAIAATGQALLGAICLGLFGMGRALMVVVPTMVTEDRRQRFLAGMVALRLPLRFANGIAAALVGITLATGTATAAVQIPGSGVTDPAISGSTLARTELAAGQTTVVISRPKRKPIRILDARHPSLNSRLIAVTVPDGVSVRQWADGREVYRVDGPVEKPSLSWPWLAYLRKVRGGTALELRNLTRGTRKVITTASSLDDLGRPSLRAGRLAWHFATARRSEIIVTTVRKPSRRRVIATSRTAIHVNPSINATHIAWVEQRASLSLFQLRRLDKPRVRSLARVSGKDRVLWTTALGRRRAYVTRWDLRRRRAAVIARTWR